MLYYKINKNMVPLPQLHVTAKKAVLEAKSRVLTEDAGASFSDIANNLQWCDLTLHFHAFAETMCCRHCCRKCRLLSCRGIAALTASHRLSHTICRAMKKKKKKYKAPSKYQTLSSSGSVLHLNCAQQCVGKAELVIRTLSLTFCPRIVVCY